VISQAGIDQARLAEIARRARMSTGQVMYYFATKEHILLDTLAWREHQDTRARRAALREITGAWGQLDCFTRRYLPASRTDPSWIMWMEAWARAPHSADVSRFLDDLIRPWRDDLATIIQAGAGEGIFTPRAPAEFPLTYCALLDGLAIVYLRQMPDLTPDRLAELALATARSQLARAGHPQPARPATARDTPAP
jgi:AcrR family transcriptional regulator